MQHQYSKLIVCELVLPDLNASLLSSALDIQMMGLGGMERSERQWSVLLASAGMKITGLWPGKPDCESVLEVMLMD